MPLHRRECCRRYWPAAAVLVAGLALTAGIGWELHREARELDEKRFALRREEVMDQLDGRVEKTEQLVQQLQDFLALDGDGRKRIFSEWCARRRLGINFPWLHGIAVATNRSPRDWRQSLPASPADWTLSDWGKLEQIALDQPFDCTIAMTNDMRDQKKYLADYDLRGHMTESNDLSLSVRSASVRVSGRRKVMLDAQGKPLTGVLLYAPVRGAEFAGLAGAIELHSRWKAWASSVRWLNLDAMIIAPLDFKALEHALWDGQEADLGVELFSSTNQTAETWLNASGKGPRAADASFQPYLDQREKWAMFHRQFSIYFYTRRLFEAQSPRRLARTAIIAGASISLLAAALAGVAIRSRSRQERMTAEVTEARDALAAAEMEREKLGHDLHDGAIQSLYAVQLGLSRTAEKVETTLPESSRVLNQTRARVDEVIAELRRFILAQEAGNASADPVGLDRVLGAMVEGLQATTTARIQLEAQPGTAAQLSPAQVVELTQLARSALANCLRHSGARQIDVSLRGDAEFVRLEIADDGSGFDSNLPKNGGMGLQTMQRRAAEAGGTLLVQSQPGQGTRIVVSLPVS